MDRWLKGYDRKSLITLAILLVIGLGVAVAWRNLLRENARDVTWFLVVIWVAMAALLCWSVSPGRDLALAIVAVTCGLAFEWWGTHTGLWTYFTGEKPPVWILPAWPVAALATARISWMLEQLHLGEGFPWRLVYWALMILFAAEMFRFTWPAIGRAPGVVAAVSMLAVITTMRDPKKDVCLFLAGGALGIALEYWGTVHNCWTYYTQETPPVFAVAAHGFAQVVYARVLSLVRRGWTQ